MVTIHTLNKHNITIKRKNYFGNVFLKIESLTFDHNGIYPKGFYYIKDENGIDRLIQKTQPIFISWQEFGEMENKYGDRRFCRLNYDMEMILRTETLDKLNNQTPDNLVFGIPANDWVSEVEIEDEE